jgi:hypothetical protein
VAQDVASSASVLERLQNFQFKDPNGKDHVSGSNTLRFAAGVPLSSTKASAHVQR